MSLSFSWFSLRSGLRGDSDYMESIDALRGWAILLVFLFHAWGISGAPEFHAGNVFLLSYIEAGRTGVTLFFVISGFLLSMPWLLAEYRGRQTPSIKNYYLARLLRVLPLYYCAIALACLVSGEWQVALKAATFQFVGFDIFPFSVVWWTLTTEVQFYLLLPLMMCLLLGGPWHRILLALLLILWTWFYLTEVVWNPEVELGHSYFLTKSIFGRLPAFLLGIIAAWVYLRLKDMPILANRWARAVRLTIIGFCLLVLERVLHFSVVLGEAPSELRWHIRHTYEAVLWTVVLLVAVLSDRSWNVSKFQHGMAYLGKLSYSFYLWHVPLLFYFIYPIKERLEDAYFASLFFYALPLQAFAVSMLASMLTYRWIELPALNLKRHLPV